MALLVDTNVLLSGADRSAPERTACVALLDDLHVVDLSGEDWSRCADLVESNRDPVLASSTCR